jgi:hypothetical protein
MAAQFLILALNLNLECQNNTTNTVDFNNIKPAADGTITLLCPKAQARPLRYKCNCNQSLYADSIKPAAPANLGGINRIQVECVHHLEQTVA